MTFDNTSRSKSDPPSKPDQGGQQRSSRSSQNHSSAGRHKKRRSSYAPDSEVAERIRHIESQPDPLSFAEQVARKYNFDTETTSEIGEVAESEQVNITKLQRMDLPDLILAAQGEGVEEAEELERGDLVLAILKIRLQRNGLMFGEGTLEILPDGYGFLRSSSHNYLVCMEDIYVSPSQIRKFNLRTGSFIAGQIRPPKESEKYFALLRISCVNGQNPGEGSRNRSFDTLTPLHPDQRVVMEYDPDDLSTRVIDLVAPIGFGQRGLIVSPPRAGKTMLMQSMARAVLHNHPNAYVVVLLIDERPEEVTDMEREVRGERCEVVSSTFDEKPARHVQVAEMVLEKAKRLVECGRDVVVFLDSISRLGRAWNQECPPSGKILSGGLDSNAMQKPKAFFGSARKLEEGGSLTIIATALIDTGSKMDDVIFEEFKGTGNSEIVLDQSIVERRIWPAIDVNRSGTRREEKLLMEKDEYERVCMLRRNLSQMNPYDTMETLTNRLRKTKTNAEFLMSLQPDKI